ncbi:MAG: tetratricopeptide repeat protein [Saprospiraceae bacterium]|nr:tetratricopeptide repeat protein [Saprospiraceae bacterium]
MNLVFRYIFWLFLLPQCPLFAQQNLDSLYQSALAAVQNYRYNEALPILYECHRSAPDNQLFLEKLGQCYYQMGNLQEGRFFLKEVLKRDSAHVPTLNLLATIEEQLLDYRSALGRAEALVHLDSTNGYYRRLAGQLSGNLGRTESAIRHYHHALRLNPNDQVSVIAFCKLLTEVGELPYADSLMDAALRKQQQNLRLLYESAKLKYARKQYDQVLPRFGTALGLGDTSLNYLPLLAYSLTQLDSNEAALPWFHYLMQRSDKPNERLHYFLGRCYQQMDSLELGFQQYEMAVKAGQSDNIGFYYQVMGDVMNQQERYKQALKFYELAQENENADPVIFFDMATAFDQLNAKDKRKAVELFKQFLEKEAGKHPVQKQYATKRLAELAAYEKQLKKGKG